MASKNKHLMGVCAVYMVKHKSTGKFYIGSSQDLYNRFHSMMSTLKAGRSQDKLQTAFDTTGRNPDDWEMTVLQQAPKSKLDKLETKYIQQHIANPDCLNSRFVAQSGKRGSNIQLHSKIEHVAATIGKNTKDNMVRRGLEVTFISPEGKEYKVISVKAFAEEMGLNQSSMSQLSNGVVECVKGWLVKGLPMPSAGHVVKYWPEERMAKHYPLYEIISPTGQRYETYSLYHFEQEHDCKVITETREATSGEIGARHYTKGLSPDGRGWRLDSDKVKTYKIIYKGKTYENILSPRKWAITHKFNHKRFLAYLQPGAVHKYKRSFSIEAER